MKKYLLSCSIVLALTLTGCQKEEVHVDKNKLVEHINYTSYINKNIMTDSLTKYEFQNMNSWLKELHNSDIYKENGQIALYNHYIDKTIKDDSQVYFFNEENYKKVTTEPMENYKLFAKSTESQIGDYVTAGIRSYSLDERFHDNDELLLNFPYLRVNPRIEVKDIKLEAEMPYQIVYMYLTLDISQLTNIEKEALKERKNDELLELTIDKNTMKLKFLLHNKEHQKEVKQLSES